MLDGVLVLVVYYFIGDWDGMRVETVDVRWNWLNLSCECIWQGIATNARPVRPPARPGVREWALESRGLNSAFDIHRY